MLGLGAMHDASWKTDPKHLGFVLARYHFVARMLEGCNRVMEVGCGEGTGARIVKAVVKVHFGIDREVKLIPSGYGWAAHDIVEDGPFIFGYDISWDAIYALDVLEHIPLHEEPRFFANITRTLDDQHGVLIIGSPSLESQIYASALSRKHHCNCKTEDGLRQTLAPYFRNVFLFGMNDMTLHTGFGPMVHYRLAICTGKKRS